MKIDVKKTKDEAIFDGQDQMIDAYEKMLDDSHGFHPDDDQSFQSFCNMWKYENNLSHVDTPKYFSK